MYVGPNPVVPAIVSLYQTNNPLFGAMTFKEYNSNLAGLGHGMYAFAGQRSTQYTVFATYNTPFGPVSSPSYNVSAPSSATNPYPANRSLWLQPVITGEVYDGNYGPSAPLGGATVKVWTSAGVTATTTANSAGVYWMPAPAGSYTVAAFFGNTWSSNYPMSVVGTTNGTENLPIMLPDGGCVLAGTDIATPDGRVAVNKLMAGAAILGYDVATGAWVDETVTSNAMTQVDRILSINDGLLGVTLTDQPLLVQNGTWVGWVRDPQNLTVGEELFNPATASWVNITSLEVLQGKFKVYDLQATAPNDFVANGVLVDRKPQ